MGYLFLDGLSLTFLSVPQYSVLEYEFICEMAKNIGGEVNTNKTGGKGYPMTASIKGVNSDGIAWSIFCGFGSSNMGQHIHMEAKGVITERFKDVVLQLGVDWSLSRADVAIDFEMDFDVGHSICQKYAKQKNIKTSVVGDWEGKEAGRTYYIGANRSSSESYIRFYEKGIEMELKGFTNVPRDVCRLELEYKPHKHKRKQITSLDARYILSLAHNPLQLFNSFSDLGLMGIKLEPKKENDCVTSIDYMVSQYSKQLSQYVDRYGYSALIDKIQQVVDGVG